LDSHGLCVIAMIFMEDWEEEMKKALIFVNDLGILLLDCGGVGLLLMEFTVCPKICRNNFDDFVDLH
jgi:hypothetical protein